MLTLQNEYHLSSGIRSETQATRHLDIRDNDCLISIPDIHCGGCVAKIERALNARGDIASARVNLTLKQAKIRFKGHQPDVKKIITDLKDLGFTAHLQDVPQNEVRSAGNHLLRRVAVAGFGAMNIMLLSVGVWSGAEGQTRQVFHLVSALIAVPVVIYAGQPFFSSALRAVRVRSLNMDVPIAMAIILATAISLFELSRGGEEVFFDASVTLLAFLLAGRYLDQLMRDRASSAVNGLMKLSPKIAMVRREDGTFDQLAIDDLSPGDLVVVPAGEPIPIDGQISRGSTDIDRSLITGEALPVSIGPGDTVESGVLNLSGEIEVLALRTAGESFLAQMIRMQTEAEAGRSAYIRIADRAARLYAPLVHLLALITFIVWLSVSGDWQHSAFIAISVLIITCPCALGLAVPVAHVVAAGQFLRKGILMKDGSALERMAEINFAVFDKTGTLTTGRPRLGMVKANGSDLKAARSLAIHSRHPAARAIADGLPSRETSGDVENIEEIPGYGVQASINGHLARLGRADWVAEISRSDEWQDDPSFAVENGPIIAFPLVETLRPNAFEALNELQDSGVGVAILSGDNAERAKHIAKELDVSEVYHGMTPADKIAYLEQLREQDIRALMVGDGLNDAAALAAAHVSMAPATASDAGRMAADFVFLRDGLEPVTQAWHLARRTASIVRQNFGLAIAYNCIAIPLAMAGYVTPLIAALAMSGSSILVIGNSLRLNSAGSTVPNMTAMRVTA